MSFGFTGSECGLKGYKVVSFFFRAFSLLLEETETLEQLSPALRNAWAQEEDIYQFLPSSEAGWCLSHLSVKF